MTFMHSDIKGLKGTQIRAQDWLAHHTIVPALWKKFSGCFGGGLHMCFPVSPLIRPGSKSGPTGFGTLVRKAVIIDGIVYYLSLTRGVDLKF